MILEVKFCGIDDWNRPVYKGVREDSTPLYFGCVYRLFSYEATEEEVNKDITEFDLEYFGRSFGCEPHGGMPFKDLELKILK